MKTTLLNAKSGTSLTDILNRLHLTQQRLSLRKTEITFKYWVGLFSIFLRSGFKRVLGCNRLHQLHGIATTSCKKVLETLYHILA